MYGYGYRYNSGLVVSAGGAGGGFSNISSLQFDGIDDYVNLGTDASLDIFGGDFTISLWAKWGAQTTNSNGIVSFGANADKALIGLGFGTEYGKISFTTRIIPNGTLYDMGSGYDDNLWHNIICTLSGTTRTCYVDGVDITATALSANLSVGTNNDIGVRDRSGQDRFFVGSVDEVCIFDRVVTPTEITTLSTSPTVDLTDLNAISWYRNGDGDTYPTITDNGSGGNSGTMTNMDAGDIVSDVPL